MARLKLKSLDIAGFKSIDSSGQTIEVGDVTVLLGANGAGKSNLVSFFKMVNYMTAGALQQYVGENGFADSLLHFGRKTTRTLEAALRFEGDGGEGEYRFALVGAAGDTLMFTHEELLYRTARLPYPKRIELGAGHKESALAGDAGRGGETSRFVQDLLKACQVFQFHDTSASAKVRLQGYIEDNAYLRSNAGNLAAFLYRLKTNAGDSKYYDRIVRRMRDIMPQFGDFVLAASALNSKYILLNWAEQGSEDYLFGPHQFPDGALRFAALATLLLQPPRTLPQVVVLDEPELGLHPRAIASLAAMVRSASTQCQLILATQSPRLVDEFDADQVVIVEHDVQHRRSLFRRLGREALADWLERYSLSELWEKNVLGGRP